MRMTFVTLAALVLCLTLSLPAFAGKSSDNINFGALSCGEFMQVVNDSDEDDIAAMLIWLDGYLSGVSGDTTFYPEGFDEFADRLVDRCSKKSGKKVLDVAREVGIQ